MEKKQQTQRDTKWPTPGEACGLLVWDTQLQTYVNSKTRMPSW